MTIELNDTATSATVRLSKSDLANMNSRQLALSLEPTLAQLVAPNSAGHGDLGDSDHFVFEISTEHRPAI